MKLGEFQFSLRRLVTVLHLPNEGEHPDLIDAQMAADGGTEACSNSGATGSNPEHDREPGEPSVNEVKEGGNFQGKLLVKPRAANSACSYFCMGALYMS